MNLILLEDSDFTSEKNVSLIGRKYHHMVTVQRVQKGDRVRVGRLNGLMGEGVVSELTGSRVDLEVSLSYEPPPPANATLLLALPRPKFLKKTLLTATSIGVKRIYIFNSYRVEKVYWSTQQIQPDEVKEACLLGLEQARDTIMPEVHFKRLFKPFIEDEVPTIIRGTQALLAHPAAETPCPYGLKEPFTLAIGPEGGFIEYEVDKFVEAGFRSVHLFPRILKVESAVATLLGRLL